MARNSRYYRRGPPQWNTYKKYGHDLGTYYSNRYKRFGRFGRGYANARAGALYAHRRMNYGFGNAEFKVYPTVEVGAGILAGLTNLDRQIPGELILAAAALPIGGRIGRRVKAFAGGVILGELISKFTGFSIPVPATASTKNMSVASVYA